MSHPPTNAPELLQEHSQPASVAADVYGLGAILYVLITGQPPFTGRNAQDVWDKIRDSQPPPPRSLNTRVDPDLEAICLKALDKNPASRYASAAALAKDLDRYLAREPVIARPIGWSQRRLRWLRNHPVSSAIAVIAGVVLFTLVAVIVVEFRSLQEQAKQIDAVRQEAETYRHALQIAEGKAARLKADMSEDERRPADMP